jgi:hypothetical protein
MEPGNATTYLGGLGAVAHPRRQHIFAEQPETFPPQPTYGRWIERCRSHLAALDRVFIGRPDDVSISDLRLIASDLARRYIRALRTLPDDGGTQPREASLHDPMTERSSS